MKELRLTVYQLKDLVAAVDFNLDEIEHFLNVETGDTVILTSFGASDEDEELREEIDEGFGEIYFRVPSLESSEGFAIMEDFTRTVVNERLQDKLWDALSGGKGVFRRFKDTLAYDGVERDRYYKFLEEQHLKRVLEWFEDMGFSFVIVHEGES